MSWRSGVERFCGLSASSDLSRAGLVCLVLFKFVVKRAAGNAEFSRG